MAGTKLRVGDIVESSCRKCNDRTGHTIVSIVEGEIAKVECRGCGSVHKHRPAKKTQGSTSSSASSASKPKKSSSKSKKSASAKEAEVEQAYQEWSNKMESRDSSEAIAYSMDTQFQTNDLIDHASFGLGIVQRTIPPNKMDVLFEGGEKRLRCAPVPNQSSAQQGTASL